MLGAPIALDGVSFEALGRFTGTQRIKCLAIIGLGLLLEPVGSSAPAVRLVDRRPLLVVARQISHRSGRSFVSGFHLPRKAAFLGRLHAQLQARAASSTLSDSPNA